MTVLLPDPGFPYLPAYSGTVLETCLRETPWVNDAHQLYRRVWRC